MNKSNFEVAPEVSVLCITYNHSLYIKQCLEGIINQNTNFKFEIIIHDDASTDGTTDIIKLYQIKFPNRIKLILQNENQWKKNKNEIWKSIQNKCSGKYIAICEGDDYWIDDYKLQKQYDLAIEQNLIFVGHNVDLLDQKSNKIINTYTFANDFITIKDAIFGPPVHTSSFFFKNIFSLISFNHNLPSSDDFLACEILSRGNGRVINETMSVYRISDSGSWSSLEQVKKDEKSLVIQLWIFNHYKIKIIHQLYRIGTLFISSKSKYLSSNNIIIKNNYFTIVLGLVLYKLINILKWLKKSLKITSNLQL